MNYRSEAEIRAAQRHEGDLGTDTLQNEERPSAGLSEGASDLLSGWWIAPAAILAVPVGWLLGKVAVWVMAALL